MRPIKFYIDNQESNIPLNSLSAESILDDVILLIVQIGWFALLVIIVVAFAVSMVFFQYGIPLWGSFALGMLTTYLLLMVLTFLLHWLLRSIVGTNSGYLPSRKVLLWGTMAALHHRLFSALRLFLPREYVPNMFLRAFGMQIGAGTANMGYITDPEMIQLGKNVYIGPGVIISGHIMSRADRRVFRAPVVIEEGAKIGMNCVITPGVHIGPNAIVLPNTHVRTNQKLEGGKIYGGNPASEIPCR